MEDCHRDGLLRTCLTISIELEEGVVAGLDELDVPRGEGVFAVVINGGAFEQIGVIEDVTAFAGGKIGDGDWVSVDLVVGPTPIVGISLKNSALALLLRAELMVGEPNGVGTRACGDGGVEAALNGDGVVISAGINDNVAEAIVAGGVLIATSRCFSNGDVVVTSAAADRDAGADFAF